MNRTCTCPYAALFLGLLSCSSQQVFWGDVHGHTANSDGKGTVEEYFQYARSQAQLDFAIVTDHDFGHAAPWRMPPQVWQRTLEVADRHTQDGQFVAIAGYEWTSAAKYWSDYQDGPSENHFAGPVKFFNHKNVYFPGPAPKLFSAKDAATNTPDLLAEAVQSLGGLIHNNHPDPKMLDQWAYSRDSAKVIANTEINPDVIWYERTRHELGVETEVRRFLNGGAITGLVAGSDTHDGTPTARTAVYATELTREAIFEALRKRHCYAVTGARIGLEFRIDGHLMGDEIEVDHLPKIHVEVRGTDQIREIIVIRDGTVLHKWHPGKKRFRVDFVDKTFAQHSYYYVRVTQNDADPHGNPSRAWSSPIWVTATGGD
jgi:uncharacterized protein DUF3604